VRRFKRCVEQVAEASVDRVTDCVLTCVGPLSRPHYSDPRQSRKSSNHTSLWFLRRVFTQIWVNYSLALLHGDFWLSQPFSYHWRNSMLLVWLLTYRCCSCHNFDVRRKKTVCLHLLYVGVKSNRLIVTQVLRPCKAWAYCTCPLLLVQF